MKNRTNVKLMLALPVVAMLAIPGAAKQVGEVESVRQASAPQAAFGLFLDPHVEPVLSFAIPHSPVAL